MATRVACVSPPESEILVEAYQEVKEQMKRNDNAPASVEQREEIWQSGRKPPESTDLPAASAGTIAVD